MHVLAILFLHSLSNSVHAHARVDHTRVNRLCEEGFLRGAPLWCTFGGPLFLRTETLCCMRECRPHFTTLLLNACMFFRGKAVVR